MHTSFKADNVFMIKPNNARSIRHLHSTGLVRGRRGREKPATHGYGLRRCRRSEAVLYELL
jgi:hypothetical protein